MEFNLDYVGNMGNAIITSEQSLNGSFNSSWDDEVHSSMGDFVRLFEGEAKAFSDLLFSMQTILEPLREVDGKKLVNEVDDLMERIEGIC